MNELKEPEIKDVKYLSEIDSFFEELLYADWKAYHNQQKAKWEKESVNLKAQITIQGAELIETELEKRELKEMIIALEERNDIYLKESCKYRHLFSSLKSKAEREKKELEEDNERLRIVIAEPNWALINLEMKVEKVIEKISKRKTYNNISNIDMAINDETIACLDIVTKAIEPEPNKGVDK